MALDRIMARMPDGHDRVYFDVEAMNCTAHLCGADARRSTA
jgi:hypothetical protein